MILNFATKCVLTLSDLKIALRSNPNANQHLLPLGVQSGSNDYDDVVSKTKLETRFQTC